MRLTFLKFLGLVTICAAALGCKSVHDVYCVDCGAPEHAEPAMKAAPAPVATGGQLVWYLPTDNKSDAVVKVTSTTPAEVAKGADFDYVLTVENISEYLLDDVVVTDVLSPGVAIKDSTPQASTAAAASGGCTSEFCPAPGAAPYTKAQWNLGCLSPGETAVIKATAVANAEGTFAHCADVDYTAKRCQQFVVISPALDIDKTMQDVAVINEVFPVEIKVWNPGTGILKDVTVVDTLPEGLVEVVSNSQKVVFEVGDLLPNEPKTCAFEAKALMAGDFVNSAVATSASGLNAEDTAPIKVTRPLLAIVKDGPARVALGREAQYDIVVTNKGDAVVESVVVTDAIPVGSAFVSASNGGIFDNEGTVSWSVGDMAPGKDANMSVTVRARQVGTMVNNSKAASPSCPSVADDAQTIVEGVPALLMEVVDSNDPILIGDTTVYTITVTNQGTAPGRNIRIKAFLEDELEYISSSGASQAATEGATVEFSAIELAVGAKAEWKVSIRAKAAGDTRFKVIMDADGFNRSVQETEATTLY